MRKLEKVFNIIIGLFFIIWFFVSNGKGGLNSEEVFYPLSMPISMLKYFSTIDVYILYLIYLVPLMGLLNITTFYVKINNLLLTFLNFLTFSIMLYALVLPLIKFAENNEYINNIGYFTLTNFLFCFIGNILFLIKGFSLLNHKSKIYCEYKEFKKNYKDNIQNKNKLLTIFDIFFRIRTKLLISFISIISFILLILSTQLLSNYKFTLLQAISDGAKNQVEQTSANYRINLGDNIAQNEYFNRQVELNDNANFKYNNLTVYTNLKEAIYLDDLSNILPDYPAEFSTLELGTRYPDLEPLNKNDVINYLNDYKKNYVSGNYIINNLYKYVSPIIKIDTIKSGDERIKRERVLGFSIITFEDNVILKPYFKTRIKVLILTALFIYLSIILVFIVSNYIVNPILYLRMNVRKISDILSLMVKGESRVSSTSLIYHDSVTSKDEIKFLSSEINNMVTVIRGIVPYISASTLQHAETGVTSSTEKEITFLFTDIRGFTTLCEGMTPDKVVTLLNKYLDLETEIIMNNGGDVDKFVGDEVMAFFQGPNRELNACRAAMEIRKAMMDEKDIREAEGLPVVNIGIGINTGNVVFGSVGARDRMDFTSIGDTVNLAARLEGANKAYGSKSIISESVYLQVKDEFLCRELDSITVKGKNEPVRIYEILQENSKAKDKIYELKEIFESGLKEYRLKKWDKALKFFIKNVKLYNDKPSEIFIERINHFKNNPVDENWDGVFRMTVK